LKNQTNLIITTTTPAISSTNLSSGPTFALVVLVGANSTPGNWIIINKASKKAKVQNRLILIRDSETLFSVLAFRNTINKAFLDKNIKRLIISSIITISNKKNLIIISTNLFTSNFLIKKRDI
jgi:hypothetical protein